MSDKQEVQDVAPEVSGNKTLALYRGAAEQAHPLARFGGSKVVRILADRIQATDNRKNALNRSEAILTAQAAIAYRLDPFAGELHSWVQILSGGRRIITIMKGRDGTLKIAKTNARFEETYLESPRLYIIPEADPRRITYMVPDGALCFECYQEDYKGVTEWYSRMDKLVAAGFTKEEINERIGNRPPADWGLGILTKEEMKNLDGGKNKMTHVERCQKRAHTAALRKRWAAQEHAAAIETATASLSDDDYVIEGEWLDIPMDEPTTKTGRELKAAATQASADLYGDSKPRIENQWEQEIIDRLVDLQLVQAKPHAVNILNRSPFMSVPYHQLEVVEAVAYIIGWSRLDDKLSSDEKQVTMNKSWNESDNDDLLDKAIEMLGGKNEKS